MTSSPLITTQHHIQRIHDVEKATSTPSTTYTVKPGKIDVNTLLYSDLCRLYDSLEKAKRLQKEQIVTDLWSKLDVEQDWYPLIRLLIPAIDSDRHTYGVKESGLADAYAQVLGLTKQSEQFLRMKHYKNPKYVGNAASVGDFSTILQDVLQPYLLTNAHSKSETDKQYTLTDINILLDNISNAGTTTNKELRQRVFTFCVQHLTARENYWLTRIVIGDLKIGLRHESVLKLFHQRAMDAFNTTSSLRHVCKLVAQPQLLLTYVSTIKYGNPFKPMLCSTPDWRDIIHLMDGQQFTVEPKYDGERIMIHKWGTNIKLYSRNSTDMTDRWNYGDALRGIINDALVGHDCIIDGELVAYNPTTGRYLRFGTNRAVARGDQALEPGAEFCYKAFDIIMHRDNVLIDTPLHKRYQHLQQVVKVIPHRFEVVKQETPASADTITIMQMLDEALLSGVEGLILKQQNTLYGLNERSNRWMKLKPEFVNGLRDTLDIIILGGFYGEGNRRSGDISHFLIGVAADYDRSDLKAAPTQWYTFGKVGSGYSNKELARLREQLHEHWQPYRAGNMPTNWFGWKGRAEDKPDVWIAPEQSVIITMKCMEVTECEVAKFAAGYTPRFPRAERFRYDKDWRDCMTWSEIKALYSTHQNYTARVPDYLSKLNDEDAERAGLRPSIKDEAGGSLSAGQSSVQAAAAATALTAGNRPVTPAEIQKHLKSQQRTQPYSQALNSNVTVNGQPVEDWQATLDRAVAIAQAEKANRNTGRGKRGGKPKDAAKAANRVTSSMRVLQRFRPTDTTNINVTSSLLDGKSFCVMSTDVQPSKDELETLIAAHGGKFSQNPILHQTTAVLATGAASDTSTLPVRVQAMLRDGRFDVLHYSWLVDSIEQQQLLPFNNKYLIHATKYTRRAERRRADPYGDDYVNDLQNVKTLESVLQEVTLRGNQHQQMNDASSSDSDVEDISHKVNSNTTHTGSGSGGKKRTGGAVRSHKVPARVKVKLEGRLDEESKSFEVTDVKKETDAHNLNAAASHAFADEDSELLYHTSHNLLHDYNFYLHSSMPPLQQQSLHTIIHLFDGATVPQLQPNVTHIIVPPQCTTDVLRDVQQQVNALRTQLLHTPHIQYKQAHIVTTQWLLDSVDKQQLVDESDYIPRV